MADKQYTLEQLEQRTGFSKRQIRYYITEKLVPGAGDQRGPYAMYGEETLQRLEMITVLKEQPMGPTGRAMTLAEIRHSLDNLPDLPLSGSPVNESLSLREPEMRLFGLGDRASDYLKKLSDEVPFSSVREEVPANMPMFNLSSSSGPVDDNPLDDLLQSLHSLLTDLGSDTRFDSKISEGNSWRRITSPDVEIQVRTPDNLEAQKRLLQMALEMGRLLAREE